MTKAAKATKDQVRKFYEDQGFEVKIDDVASGHVLYRNPSEKLWSDGSWVSEYRVFGDHIVLT